MAVISMKPASIEDIEGLTKEEKDLISRIRWTFKILHLEDYYRVLGTFKGSSFPHILFQGKIDEFKSWLKTQAEHQRRYEGD